ncbi:unnamed protein product [Amoebophrya sp. A120]|nr:unnamed protein product [Amoebophrya sp. A120]|eukprot:GSA120T00018454001.1
MSLSSNFPLKRGTDFPPSGAPAAKRLKHEGNSSQKSCHVIFCIDQSGSMRQTDVAVGKSVGTTGQQITRWKAVFNCAQEFVEEQEKADRNLGLFNNSPGSLYYSLILWQEEATVVFQRQESGVATRLRNAASANQPRGGTTFAAGIRKAREVLSGGTKPQHFNEKVLLLFLSDGRPGDLQVTPPAMHASAPKMQTHHRSHGKEYPSVGTELADLQNYVGEDKLQLHFVGIYPEGFPWLRYLAWKFDGTFHESTLQMDEIAAQQPAAPQPSALFTASAATQSTGMRSTFFNISTALTCFRSDAPNPGLGRERAVQLEGRNSASSARAQSSSTSNSEAGEGEQKFSDVRRMVLKNADSEEFKPVPLTQEVAKTVILRDNPFAQGGIRNVYKMRVVQPNGGAIHMVAKESRHEGEYAERLRFHAETSKCQGRAIVLSTDFKKALRTAAMFGGASAQLLQELQIHSNFQFVPMHVYRLKDSKVKGGFRYLAAEPELEGDYRKYNGNNGWVCQEVKDRGDAAGFAARLAQAFSHWTSVHTNGTEMVVDIQGTHEGFTDPQLHSLDGKYGRADRKAQGMKEFFDSHRCGEMCRLLKIAR